MNTLQTKDVSLQHLSSFWWLFALRGGFALLFSGVLFYTSTLMGMVFFDPVLLVVMGLLIGFFVFGNGIILGVATVFAAEHHRPVWRVILAEAVCALALGAYIAGTLLISPRSVAMLAGLLALVTSFSAGVLAIKLRHEKRFGWALALLGIVSIGIGITFLLNQQAEVKATTAYLSALEMFQGVILLVLTMWLKSSVRVLVAPASNMQVTVQS